jgi:hypothetical protein
MDMVVERSQCACQFCFGLTLSALIDRVDQSTHDASEPRQVIDRALQFRSQFKEILGLHHFGPPNPRPCDPRIPQIIATLRSVGESMQFTQVIEHLEANANRHPKATESGSHLDLTSGSQST